MAVDLVDEYRKQRAWRPWPAVFRLLPDVSGQIVLDLGCGIGDQAAELSDRDATVIAVDGNDVLLDFARARAIPRVDFRNADIHPVSRRLGPPMWGQHPRMHRPMRGVTGAAQLCVSQR
jgi:trans-aconitate methyltransferase